MLCLNQHSKDYVVVCRTRTEAQFSAYEKLKDFAQLFGAGFDAIETTFT